MIGTTGLPRRHRPRGNGHWPQSLLAPHNVRVAPTELDNNSLFTYRRVGSAPDDGFFTRATSTQVYANSTGKHAPIAQSGTGVPRRQCRATGRLRESGAAHETRR